jgi:hypothetical protein
MDYAFIKGNSVLRVLSFEDSSTEDLLNHFVKEFNADFYLPAAKYAVDDGTYDGAKFWRPQPYPSWVKDEEANEWKAPVEKPNDDKFYVWDEPTLSWKKSVPPTA